MQVQVHFTASDVAADAADLTAVRVKQSHIPIHRHRISIHNIDVVFKNRYTLWEKCSRVFECLQHGKHAVLLGSSRGVAFLKNVQIILLIFWDLNVTKHSETTRSNLNSLFNSYMPLHLSARKYTRMQNKLFV
jgi:hypothetical protein